MMPSTTPSTHSPGSDFLQPALDKLLAHPLYDHVNTVSRLRVFMREHAFAVWDFMTLLKRLQHDLCGTQQPWSPPLHPHLARFVNEIVLAEESDTDARGGFASHFELYLSAMEELGADTAPVRQLVHHISHGRPAAEILPQLAVRPETREFVAANLHIAAHGDPWEVAAVFCYGREDVIPAMFAKLLRPIAQARLGSERFEYYLQRHIELDGNEHGPLSLRLVQTLIADSPERRHSAQKAGERAIAARIRLWDGILAAIQKSESADPS